MQDLTNVRERLRLAGIPRRVADSVEVVGHQFVVPLTTLADDGWLPMSDMSGIHLVTTEGRECVPLLDLYGRDFEASNLDNNLAGENYEYR